MPGARFLVAGFLVAALASSLLMLLMSSVDLMWAAALAAVAVTGARGPFGIFRAGSSWVSNDEAEPKIGGGVAPATPAASAQPSGSYLWIIEEHS